LRPILRLHGPLTSFAGSTPSSELASPHRRADWPGDDDAIVDEAEVGLHVSYHLFG